MGETANVLSPEIHETRVRPILDPDERHAQEFVRIETGKDPRRPERGACRVALRMRRSGREGWHPRPIPLSGNAMNLDPGVIPGWLFRPPIRRTT
jgi:hypothetical protein